MIHIESCISVQLEVVLEKQREVEKKPKKEVVLSKMKTPACKIPSISCAIKCPVNIVCLEFQRLHSIIYKSLLVD